MDETVSFVEGILMAVTDIAIVLGLAVLWKLVLYLMDREKKKGFWKTVLDDLKGVFSGDSASAKDSEKAKAISAPWTCSYCGQKNMGGTVCCSRCDAERKLN